MDSIKIGTIFAAIVGIIVLIFAFTSVSNVELEEYHVVQNYITGNVYAKTTPGWYCSAFCNVRQLKSSETFYFTADNKEGGQGDASIEVQYNDGAKGRIGGTCRVQLPRDEAQLIALVKNNFTDWTAIEDKLILPVVRKSIVLTANSLSSKESYSDRRGDIFVMAWDQIENGPYKMSTRNEKVDDPITGQKVTKIVKEIVMENGKPVRETNPLEGTGVHLSNFELKQFIYTEQVERQIKEQQENMMAVQTAKATAQKAEQQALTAEAEGKANVMKAKYEQEVQKSIEVTKAEKEVAVAEQQAKQAQVIAEQQKKVAEIAAEKEVSVAELAKKQALVKAGQDKEVADVALQTAEINKKAAIATAEGQAESRKMILAADGALAQKLELAKYANEVWANAYAKRPVPQIMFGGKDGATGAPTEATTIMDMLQVKLAKDLVTDFSVTTPKAAPAPAK